MMFKQDTSWETSHRWYDQAVGKEGHYYHRTLILPKTIDLLQLHSSSRLLDVGCGQGVLARAIDPNIDYCGIDGSKSLIAQAKRFCRSPNQQFHLQDATNFSLERTFSHAALILALQNMDQGAAVIQSIGRHLEDQGTLVLVLNHPCFRIPRQSHWIVDKPQQIQSRRIDRYFSPLTIPIDTHPSQPKSEQTWSFHHPLSTYCQWLFEAGFLIDQLQEWCSDKNSIGKQARMENRARQEFPLFLAIRAKKISLPLQ